DTLSGIAARYGVTIDAIMAANNLPNRSTIYAGQSLVIPSASAPASPPQSTAGTYTVQANDSLTSVAARFGVTLQALASANGLSVSSYLYVGQLLVIPGAAQQPAKATNTPKPPSPAPTNTSIPPTAVQPTAVSTTSPEPVTAPSQAEKGKPVKYTVQPGDTLSKIAAQFSTTVANLQRLNNLGNTNYIYSGQLLVIVAGDDQNNEQPAPTPTAKAEPTPPMGKYGPKWFDVDISDQTITAYEGDTPVYTSLVSTGTYKHPTVEGTYRVYAKYVKTKMEGGQGTDEYYNIPDVPYTMYFYGSYGLHGAYWHNNFGHVMSHGCVNLPVDVSRWMFDWAPIGTMVVTHQ
ncbi:MAG: LysM peptidoglycan-binding domain-containing protein, partial [Chloroflexia bacterium]